MDTVAFEQELQRSLRSFQEEIAKIRSGKVSFPLLEAVTVPVSGRMFRLNQLAHIAVQGNSVTIEPWDESSLGDIADTVAKTFNLNPQRDGKMIRLNFPPITEEAKRDILKLISKRKEEVKISARSKRDDLLKQAKREKEAKTMTEDQLFKMKEKADKIIERFNQDLDKATVGKEKEIMSA